MNKLLALELLGAAGLLLVLRQGRRLRRQIESLRAEIAAARIAGALDTDGSVP
ncbi:hypothetical protein [Streptomyces cyaneofuscatus]|uniref:hypothetical protein n=1 Tax=Streptomyces cyaneofuscatus TaxID=66883 RepID=UPI0037A2C92F